jgi:hypothetical protein
LRLAESKPRTALFIIFGHPRAFMRPAAARVVVATLFLSPLGGSSIAAQASCSGGNRLVRSGVGVTLGAWVGFVAAKIKLSDWNDASRGAAANRTRNNATLAGAIAGLALANIHFGPSKCGSAAALAGTPTAPIPAARKPITADEIARSGVSTNVYDLVYSLRRNWLNLRGIETFSEAPRTIESGGVDVTIPGEPQLVIYLDNTRLGTVSQLRTLPVAGVLAVRYFDGPQATFKFGSGHSHGAIVVVTVPESSAP